MKKSLLLTLFASCSFLTLHGAEQEQPNPNAHHPLKIQAMAGELTVWMMDERTRRNCALTNGKILNFLDEASQGYDEVEMDYVLNKHLIPDIAQINNRWATLGHHHALEMAIGKCSTQIVQQMIKLRADATALTTADHPVSRRSLVMLTTEHFYIPEQEKITIIQALIDNRASLEMFSPFSGQFPIHQAAINGHIKLAQFLVTQKATIDTPTRTHYHNQNSEGTTPLMLAALNRHVEMAQWLLKQGAQINKKNKKNETALDYALCSFPSPQKFDMQRLLIEHDTELSPSVKQEMLNRIARTSNETDTQDRKEAKNASVE